MQRIRKLIDENKGFLFFLFGMIIVRSAVADWYGIPSGSMYPTLMIGDRIVSNRLAYDVKLPFTDVVLKHLADPNFLPALDPLARVELQSQAETEIRVQQREARAAAAEARANAREALADFDSIIGTGLPPSQAVLDQTRARRSHSARLRLPAVSRRAAAMRNPPRGSSVRNGR